MVGITAVFAGVVIVLLPVFSSAAQTRTREEILKDAEAAWANRTSQQDTIRAMELFEQAAAMDPRDMETRLMAAEAAYWAAEINLDMDGKEMIKILSKGVKAAEEVLELDPDNPGAYTWRMWNMAAITVYEGIFRGGYSFKEAIVGTIKVPSRDVNYYYGAIYTYWGRVIFTMPGLLGRFFHFTEDDAIWLYRQAMEVEPDFFKTRFYLAESYLKKGDMESAKRELRYIVDTPASSLPEREPENSFYQGRVRTLYSEHLEP